MKKNIYFYVLIISLFNCLYLSAQWEKCDNPKGGNFSCIAVDDDCIAAGTKSQGVFISTDKGMSWIDFNTGLASQIYHIAVLDEYIIVQTLDGIFRSKLTDFQPTTVNDINYGENKINVSPNPATDYIEIQPSEGWHPSEGSNILIYNTLGEIIMSVEQTSSSIQNIDISKLIPGMYFIKIRNKVEKFVKI